MSRNVLLMRKGSHLTKDKWAAMAKALNVRLIETNATSKAEFLDTVKSNEIEVIASTVPGILQIGGFAKDLVASLPPSVKVISHDGAGYDALGDVHELKNKGILVSNTPNAVIQSTADVALYLVLGTLRNFNGLATKLRQGQWYGGLPLADEPGGKTLGILGLGGIGAVIRDKIKGSLDFDKIQYHNRRRQPAEIEKDTEYVSFDQLLATSDVIVVSVPLNSNTRHLIDAKALAKCKDGAIIVNTARGPIIDEQALVDALESGKIKSVGLDVYENEPKIHEKLLSNENVLLLPHVGTHTELSRRKMQLEVLENVESYFKTGKLKTLVAEFQNSQ